MKQAKRKDATIEVCAKCSDLRSHTVIGADGSIQSEYSGYVPSFMPGQHYGDYVMLKINPYTGKILDWTPWKRAKKPRKAKSK